MKEKKNIKALIFDMDGTIFDTERLYYRIWFELAAERGYIINDEMLTSMRGASIQKGAQIFSEVNPDFDYARERALRMERVFSYVREHGVPKKPGLDEVMEYLHRQQYKICIGSSTPRPQVQRYLDSIDYEKHFDAVITGDLIENGKPAPDIFLLCAETLGLRAEECLVVEDSRNGVTAGHAAGCFVVGIPDLDSLTPVREKMDAELSSLRRIPGWLES